MDGRLPLWAFLNVCQLPLSQVSCPSGQPFPPPRRAWWVSGLNYLKWYLPYGHNGSFALLKGAWSRDKALSEDMGETYTLKKRFRSTRLAPPQPDFS